MTLKVVIGYTDILCTVSPDYNMASLPSDQFIKTAYYLPYVSVNFALR